jgi:hypothetical protein
MYDIKSDRLNSADISQIISGNITYGMDNTPESVKGDDVYDTVRNVISAVGTSVENAFSSIGNAIAGIGIAGGKLASLAGIGKYDDGYATSRAL